MITNSSVLMYVKRMNNTSYQAVSCALHDEYESAVVLKQTLQLRWTDDTQQKYEARVIARDLITQHQQEFLIVNSDDGTRHQIRLDHILSHHLIKQS